jgi:hypothetical protein
LNKLGFEVEALDLGRPGYHPLRRSQAVCVWLSQSRAVEPPPRARVPA